MTLRTTVFTGATIIDGTGRDPIGDSAIRIDASGIQQVGHQISSRGSDVVDVTGLTVLPGLIDAHVHLGWSSNMQAVLHGELSAAERAADIFNNLQQTLLAGFTTVRDTGGLDLGVIRAVERGLVPGPRIWACGAGLCQCGGHGHLHSPLQSADDPYRHDIRGLTAMGRYCDGPDQVRHACREVFRRGGSFLKLSVTGGVISFTDALGDTQFAQEEIAVAVAEAKARNTYVTVHAHNAVGARNAIRAGVGGIEHGTGIDEETAALMADHNVHLVPTLAIARMMLENFDEHGLPPEIKARVGDTEKGMREALLAARAAGVLVGSGSDLVGPVQNRRGLELVLKAEVIGAMAAIESATAINARIMGVADRLGTLEPGKYADLIAVDFDPLSTPELFDDPARVVLVVKGGRIVKDTRETKQETPA
ncbi:amidohydrolase family protein [Nocardia sp. NPDC049149]|uniref:metal-dependent hydrolase family protein n=1 Tax=Nocardia sp. NPDC049149 TaxID=3364315 RepID=UPI0037237DF7